MSVKPKTKEDYLKECQLIAKKRGGKCLSKKYVNTHTKLEWECAEGHKWMAAPGKIKSARWCPDCAKKIRGSYSKLSIEEMQEIAKKRNGTCLSRIYTNSKAKLTWQCSEGHIWEAAYDSIQTGRWCPECGRKKSILARTYSIDNAQKLAKERGGKCLSTEYVNAQTKLGWECADEHQWEATYNSIQVGSWCPECGRKKSGLARRNSIEDAQRLANDRGGKCLSKKYTGATNNLLWRCYEGHQWESAYTNIQSGTWCPECDRQKKGLARNVSIKDAQELAKERGGECLSEKYEKSNAKLTWQCSEGHTWEAVYSSVQAGSWCSQCAGNQLLSIEQMQLIAKKRGGECLSKKYINSNTKLKWICSEGHVWEVKPSHIKAGSWCPKCAGTQLLSIEDAQELAKERGGRCRSKVYKSANLKLKWECQNGHQWETTYGNIQSGKWCPECVFYFGEKFCRLSFESLFRCKFPKSHPNWLKSKEGNQLELDGYSKELWIAFEHHGDQHYKFKNRFHGSQKDFEKQKARDRCKKELCKKHNVILIVVPQVPDVISLENLTSYVIQELENNKVKTAHLDHQVPNFNKIYLKDGFSEAYDELKEIAKTKNGNILSDIYLGSMIKLEFECKEGHIWRTLPTGIKGGAWCPECANINRNNSKKLTIDQMQLIAKERGGKCLSKEYINTHTKLKWECAEGHQWMAKPSHIKDSIWCPNCGRKKSGLTRRNSIEDAQRLANDRGGKCLSKKYDVYPNKLTWQCSEGHKWESSYTNIQSGRWCPGCAKEGNEVLESRMCFTSQRRSRKGWHP